MQTPLFHPDRDTLKTALRLSGASKPASEALIDEAILGFRVWINRRLGAARVSQITTEPAAELLEIKWVRLALRDTMPTLFMDDSAQTSQVWNEEGLSREGQISSEQRARLQEEIDDLAEGLVDPPTDEDDSFKALALGGLEPCQRPKPLSTHGTRSMHAYGGPGFFR